MESDIRSITKEMISYYLEIIATYNDNSLTTIQKKEYQESTKRAFEAKGIRYFISFDHEGDNHSRICFQSPPWYANDVGIINDVSPEGAFPFSLSIGDNISISYDPRKLKEKDSSMWSYLKNKEFLNFQKGSEYKFKGKISYCDYYFEAKPKEKFHFAIIGGASQKDNCFIATACYGNYEAPEVLVLRKYRDDNLSKTLLGKVFVKIYYSFSPSFATLISESDFIKKIVRRYFLEPIVRIIQRHNKI